MTEAARGLQKKAENRTATLGLRNLPSVKKALEKAAAADHRS